MIKELFNPYDEDQCRDLSVKRLDNVLNKTLGLPRKAAHLWAPVVLRGDDEPSWDDMRAGNFANNPHMAVTLVGSVAVAGEFSWPLQYGIAVLRRKPFTDLRVLPEYPDLEGSTNLSSDNFDLLSRGIPFNDKNSYNIALNLVQLDPDN